MAGLSGHLGRVEGHAALAFRPDCPLCRAERVLGAPAGRRPAGAGTAAALAACALLAAPAAPAGAQTQQELDAVLGQLEGVDQVLGPVEEDPPPGQDVDAEPTPAGPDDGPPTAEELQELQDLQNGVPSQPEAESEPPVPPSGDPLQDDGAGPGAPPPPQKRRGPAAPVAGEAPEKAAPKKEPLRGRERPDPQVVPAAPANDAVPAPRPEPPPAPPPPPGGPTYTVKPGDTLWSIARRALGSDASSASVARRVDRLWALNAARIGSGDPDLIRAGQVLLLR